jgi:tetraprenyl-beta-curcumene synthase
LPEAARAVRRWRARARAVPDAPIREDALNALTEQRTHIDGAVLFSILPRARCPTLLRLLVAFEIIWDFLDNVNERSAAAGVANGIQLHLALVDALDPAHPTRDWYRYVPAYADGGYLRALVEECRAACERLPSYGRIRSSAVREGTRGLVCAINHDPEPPRRDATLKAWAAREFPAGHEASWFELTGAASTDLTIYALFALAAEPTCSDGLLLQTSLAYFPWVSVLTAMLDSYVDQFEDAAAGNHSYVAHYPGPAAAAERICLLIRRCLREAGSLKAGERHAVIAGCMFGMYLSKDAALTPALRETTRRMVDAGGSLTRLLHPILRLWRTVYGLRSA